MHYTFILNFLDVISSIILALVAVYVAIEWKRREKWSHDQKEARDFLRKLGELKFHINEARPAWQQYPCLTDSLLAEKGIGKKVSDLSEKEKEYFQASIYYSEFLNKVQGYIINLRVMKDMIKALGWDERFIKKIAYIEVLIRVLRTHVDGYVKGHKVSSSYFYWDIEEYKQKSEKGEDAWGHSINFFSKKDVDKEKFLKHELQRADVMYSTKMFDSSEEKGGFFDREIDETFDKLFALLSEKIGKKSP